MSEIIPLVDMIVNKELANSNGVLLKDLWGTEQGLFDLLNEEFYFSFDVCAEDETAKCPDYFTPEIDGLSQDWSGDINYMNPPYSRGNIDKWMDKALNESEKGTSICCLIPVSTSAKWWHRTALKGKILFIQGRVKFQGSESTAPFSSAVVLFNLNTDWERIVKTGSGKYEFAMVH